ncbi:MAG TPA: hypothetical protein VFP72_21375, partial [Kineosporiaceae bacterium]|nr:hypothetical protein [Kineosporiaceae bacterium]
PDDPDDPDDESASAPPPAPEPEPLAAIVYEILAALRPVLQRHPGLTVGVWPAGIPAEQPGAAVRFTLDANDELTLRLPDVS